MGGFYSYITLALALVSFTAAFPSHAPLARGQLGKIRPTYDFHLPEDPPGPLEYSGTKLVNDAEHPWMPLREGDIRGPCPGLNTLASHGYLPRNGIATPAQIVNAVQEGFNMDNKVAKALTYGFHLVVGNVVTNLMSIGRKTPGTGPDPPAPAIVGGLNNHGLGEGDASLTRGDAYFGDNFNFNETLFGEFVEASNKFGAGKYNLTVAGELRFQRIQESIATNPTFNFVSLRFFGAYAEAASPINFFIDGRHNDGQLDLDIARGFFQHMRMPEGFHRASKPSGAEGIEAIFAAHPTQPGANVGGVNNYVPDPTSANVTNSCLRYKNFVNRDVRSVYPNPTGALRRVLNFNLKFFHEGFGNECPRLYPYGKDDE